MLASGFEPAPSNVSQLLTEDATPRLPPPGLQKRYFKRYLYKCYYLAVLLWIAEKATNFPYNLESKFWKSRTWGPPVQFSFILLSRIEKANMLWKILISFFLVSMQAYVSSDYDCMYLVTTYVCTCVCTYYILTYLTKVRKSSLLSV